MVSTQSAADQQSDGAEILGKVFIRMVRACSCSVTTLLHHGKGPRWDGIGIMAIPVIFLYSLIWQDTPYSLVPLGLLLLAAMASVAAHNVQRVRKPIRGIHSQYDGTPYLMRLCPWWSEWTIKRWVEPAAMVILGTAIIPLSPPLGMYLFLAAGCTWAWLNMSELHFRHQVYTSSDNLHQQRILAEHLREVNGDNF